VEVAVAYYYAGEHGTRVVDAFADPGYLVDKVQAKRASSWLWRLNYAHWRPTTAQRLDYKTSQSFDLTVPGPAMLGSWATRCARRTNGAYCSP